MRKPIIENAYSYQERKANQLVIIKFQELPLFLETLEEHLGEEYCYDITIIQSNVCFGCSYEDGLVGLSICLVDFTKPLSDDDELFTQEEQDDLELEWDKDFRRFLNEKIKIIGSWQGACEGVVPFVKNQKDRDFEFQVQIMKRFKNHENET